MSGVARAVPRATMRLQLHAGFTFADASQVVPYMAALGVSHLYASPIMTATAGSRHGYDVVDPTRVNPELGGEPGFRRLVAVLRQHGMGIIIDIVPNHMAVGVPGNVWWDDVLRQGQASQYSGFFDIDWNARDPALRGKVLAPFLGRPYGEALAGGDIVLALHDGRPVIQCSGCNYPLRPEDEATVTIASGRDPASLHALLERQHYRLAWWGTAGDEINWRRFFDINGLAALRIEDPLVFEAVHGTCFRLYAEGLIDGFRVDHVDGLSDPIGYSRRLRARLRELEPDRPSDVPPGPAYVVVEKILGRDEALPTDWGIDGTSGYDFMDTVNAVQHDPAAQDRLERFWSRISGRSPDFGTEETAARRTITDAGFTAQLEAAVSAFHDVAHADIATRDITAAAIRRAALALLAHFPVYRTYAAGTRRSAGDNAAFHQAKEAAEREVGGPALDMLDRCMGGAGMTEANAAAYRVAATRFQQLSAPIAAKAVEDTAFYRYGRLLSRNDVGFDAARLGASVTTFHESCMARQRSHPAAMLATATHDHKRGEDVRARLAVLSEVPADWEALAEGWLARHAATDLAASDRYMLFQMIVGAWPLGVAPDDADAIGGFAERLSGWQLKALREAKLRTSWAKPDAGYEAAGKTFLHQLLANRQFVDEVVAFVETIAPAAAANGLAQAVLKYTVPGVPDLFQGTEFWDLSLVDPDNRRPVDFAARVAALGAADPPVALARTWQDGRIKQAVIARLLALRAAEPSLFEAGPYLPLQVDGPAADHVLAFSRGDLLVVVARLTAQLGIAGDLTIPAAAWQGTRLVLQRDGAVTDVLTGQKTASAQRAVSLTEVLRQLPVAVLQVDHTA